MRVGHAAHKRKFSGTPDNSSPAPVTRRAGSGLGSRRDRARIQQATASDPLTVDL